MPWGAIIGAVGSIAAGAMGSDASRSAANKQSDAATAAAAAAREERKPWTEAGKGALGTLSAGIAPGGQFATPFSMGDAKNSEAEKFAMKEGLGALNNSAAARGGLLGTNNQEQNIKYAEGVAGTFENQAFNQWLGERQQALQPIESMAGLGFTSAGQTADANANAILAAGGAQAGGAMGSAGAWGGAAGNIGNSGLTNMDSLKKLFGGSSGGGTVSPNGTYDPSSAGYVSPNSPNFMGPTEDVSDERLKEDVVHVGKTNDGLPIYRYRMKGGGPMKMGVMADDVEKKRPDAVRRGGHGFKMVDYSKVS